MAYGKPIVSFDLNETRYTAGDAAVYVKDNNPINFGAAIIDLINNENKRKKMGNIGFKRLENYFTWEHSEKVLTTLYYRLFNLNSTD